MSGALRVNARYVVGCDAARSLVRATMKVGHAGASNALPNYVAVGWFALLGPNGTAADVAGKINRDMNSVMGQSAGHRSSLFRPRCA